jgi:hypothetical protein
MDTLPCIGLFGTCGASRWRDRFVQFYRDAGIRYFNPQVDDWTPAHADVEAAHLKRDEIILFPVTDETYGNGSLAETGFSILQAIASNASRWVIVMIAPEPGPHLKDQLEAWKDNVRARRLVKAHLAANPMPNVFVVDDLEAMFALSVELYGIARSLRAIEARMTAA